MVVVLLVSCAVTESQEDNYHRTKRVSSFDGANQLLNYQIYQYADGNVRSDSYDGNSNLTSYNIYVLNSSGHLIAESNYNADGTLMDFHITKRDLNNRIIVAENYIASGLIDYYTSNEYYDSRRVVVSYRNGVAYTSNFYELRTNSNQPLKNYTCANNGCAVTTTYEFDSANRLIRENFLPGSGVTTIYEYSTNLNNPGYIRSSKYLSNNVLYGYATFEYETYFSPTVPPRSIFRGIRY